MHSQKVAPPPRAVACLMADRADSNRFFRPHRFPGVLLTVMALITLGIGAGRLGAEKGGGKMEGSDSFMGKRILLLGASVGGAWNIPGLPGRTGLKGYEFEYVHGGSSFDKGAALNKILDRRGNRPDAVFLKECAAYFPGDLERYKALMIGWIAQCREKGIVPIPTTVVPVTGFHAYKKFGIDILKLRNPFRYGLPFGQRRLKSILVYNDWIRAYCRESGLSFLDLEAALRKSPRKRKLRSSLARVDGLHLKPKAYPLLDKIVPPLLDGIAWAESGRTPATPGRSR